MNEAKTLFYVYNLLAARELRVGRLARMNMLVEKDNISYGEYSWIERPCHYRHTHVLSVSKIARTDPRPATSVSERGASCSGLYIL